ncbi:MAG: protein translocase subunit SecF, partial [Bacilli bacterium]|nr:protein translocase subunit SecF [Bacilli bacterium]
RNVSSIFGEQALNKTLWAGLIGIAVILIFMTLIYHFAGLISGIGIIFYIFLVFLIFWLIGGVLTLPGIASLVLGIGMAVDACVISFEQIKEELKKGRSFIAAHKEGYQRSLSAIIDANITTLIVAIIMFIFGESSVKGFATMLIINIIVTIVIMVFIIKYLLKLFINTKYFNEKPRLFINLKKDNINKINNYKEKKQTIKFNFFKHFRLCYIGSLIIIIISIIFYFQQGFNLSVDYKGGTYITLISKDSININTIKKDITEFNYQYNDIHHINNKNTVYIKLDNVLNKDQLNQLEDHLETKYKAESETGIISNIVKKELTKNAIYSIILAAIGMVIYVTIRFKFSFALAALIPLLHDALLVLAIFTIFRLEIAVIFIAAILTIVGYSINDTVVIFDRIRENIKNNEKETKQLPLKDIINSSLNNTINRTLNTTITTMLPIIALISFGSFAMLNFNIAIILGLIIGTYSSIFLASQIWYHIETSKFGTKFNTEIEDELDEIEISGINK